MLAEESLERSALDATLRERATYRSAIDFDADNTDVGWFWTQRFTASATSQLTSGVSGSLSIVSALLAGNEASPIEQNNLDVQEAFLDITLGRGRLRLGRQEASFGSQRLVATRDGTNVRRTWDGIRYRNESDGWSFDAVALWLVDVEPNGAFNDRRDEGRSLAGLYLTREIGPTSLDVYYLYSRIDDRLTIEGVADQRRHSVGARVFGDRNAWFWNWEAVVQLGDHGDTDIFAWTLASNTGIRLPGAWSPEWMLSVNVASGDDDVGDDRLGTFDALYPRGSYFSEAAILGPANFFNVNPYLRLSPRRDVSVSLDVNWYWRLETADAVYGPPGVPIRVPDGSDERFVARAVSLALEWQLGQKWLLGLVATHSSPQAFIEDTGPADTVGFVELSLEARF